MLKVLVNLIGGEEPALDDVDDIFNLIDINGDETVDRKEFSSLLNMFFQVLREQEIKVEVQRESDLAT